MQNAYEIFYAVAGQLPWSDAVVNPWKVFWCPFNPAVALRRTRSKAKGQHLKENLKRSHAVEGA